MKITLTGLSLLLLSVLALAGCSRATAPNYAEIPAGKAYVNGEEIFFSHTETSDPGVAEALTAMMKSPVILVPSLADVPASSTAKVYVFQNGIAGSGPFKFQADVFDNQPGDEGYSPLREIHLVNWVDAGQARELKSEQEILDLLAQGLLTVEESNIIVNMPFMTWVGGNR